MKDLPSQNNENKSEDGLQVERRRIPRIKQFNLKPFIYVGAVFAIWWIFSFIATHYAASISF